MKKKKTKKESIKPEENVLDEKELLELLEMQEKLGFVKLTSIASKNFSELSTFDWEFIINEIFPLCDIKYPFSYFYALNYWINTNSHVIKQLLESRKIKWHESWNDYFEGQENRLIKKLSEKEELIADLKAEITVLKKHTKENIELKKQLREQSKKLLDEIDAYFWGNYTMDMPSHLRTLSQEDWFELRKIIETKYKVKK